MVTHELITRQQSKLYVKEKPYPRILDRCGSSAHSSKGNNLFTSLNSRTKLFSIKQRLITKATLTLEWCLEGILSWIQRKLIGRI